MSTKICFDDLKKYFEEHGFYVLDENCNGGASSKVNIIDEDGYRYFTSMNLLRSNVKNGDRPYRFAKNNPHTIDNIKLWIKLENKPYEFYEGEYKDSYEKNLFFKCNKCGEKWNAQWIVIGVGIGCPYCDGKRVGQSNCLGNLRPDLISEWDYDKNYPITPFDVCLRSKKYAWWSCNICGHSWKTIIYNRTGNSPSTSTNCPNCRRSSGEIIIERFLDKYSIIYTHQKRFKDCKYKNVLSYDFFLPDFNYCIEYQGEQHYFPVNFGKMEKTLCEDRYEKQKEKDQIKLEYCKNNNINLLILPYWDFGKIEQILFDKFIKI
jgi:DNA-directed RNA polymerase subunit RPC12/RpoP